MKIGLPNYEAKSDKSPKKKYFKLKNGDNFYRILPPCGSLADSGEWKKFYEVHFGYKGSPNAQGNAPHRPFLCPQRKNRAKQVIQPCAEHDKIDTLKVTLERQKEELKDKRKSSEEVKNVTAPLTDFLMQHNLDRKYHLNVKAADGSIGCLKIPYAAYKDLEDTIKTVRAKYKIDPIAPNEGVWFNFKRRGEVFYEIEYKVEVQMEMVDTPVGKAEVLKNAKLTDEDLSRMETEAFDLGEMYTKVTSEQVQRLVDSDGDPEVVDAVFARDEEAPTAPGGSPSLDDFRSEFATE